MKQAMLRLFTLSCFLGLPQGHAKEPASKSIGDLYRTLSQLDSSEQNAARRASVLERLADLERARKRPKRAFRAYRKAIFAYAQIDQKSKIHNLLGRLASSSADWPNKFARSFKRLLLAWSELDMTMQLARSVKKTSNKAQDYKGTLATIGQSASKLSKIAHRASDYALSARCHQLKARLAELRDRTSRALYHYRQAVELCDKGYCPKRMRSEIQDQTAEVLENADRLSEAYRAYTRINYQRIQHLPKEKQRHERSAEMSRVCAKLIKRDKSGRKACQRLEQQMVGLVTYEDFSRGPQVSRLNQEQISKVHDEYLHLLVDCLHRAVRQRIFEPGDQLDLFWTVRNDGSTRGLECRPDLEGDSLFVCLQNSLELFRYPRYRGQRRSISLPLMVH